MVPVLEFVFRNFQTFVGSLILLYVCLYFPTNLILQIVHKSIRAKTIRMKGYPPPHCDGDGDFFNKIDEDKKHGSCAN